MTSKAVVETEETTETTVAHPPRLLLTTQGEQLINPFQPPGQLMAHQMGVNSLPQDRGRSQSAPTVIDLVTQRTNASPRSGPNNPLVSQPHSRPDPSQVMWLTLINIRLMNTIVPSWHLFLLPPISTM